MYNKIIITDSMDSRVTEVTPTVIERRPLSGVRQDGLILGHAKSAMRGLYRNKITNRPYTLTSRDLLGHVFIQASDFPYFSQWLLDKVSQSAYLGWSSLYIDFSSQNTQFGLWNHHVPEDCHQSAPLTASDFAESFFLCAHAYIQGDLILLRQLADTLEAISILPDKSCASPFRRLIIFDNPDIDFLLFTRMFFASKEANTTFIFRFTSACESPFCRMIYSRCRTKIDFSHFSNNGLPLNRGRSISL